MSKEEALLELVLDKFASIKEVLNATKDIEDILGKLKKNKKTELTAILKKTKGLVESVYDHSTSVKDEFYKHYNELNKKSPTKEKSKETTDNCIDQDDNTSESNQSDNIGAVNSIEISLDDNTTNTSDSGTIELTPETLSKGDKDLITNLESLNQEDNTRSSRQSENVEAGNSKETSPGDLIKNLEIIDQEDDTRSSSQSENVEAANSKETSPDDANELNLSAATELTPKKLSNEDKDLNTNLESRNESDMRNKSNKKTVNYVGDNISEQKDDLQPDSIEKDPLEDMETSDTGIIESSLLNNDEGLNNNKDAYLENVDKEIVPEPTESKSLIRLVDLNKLMAPKPKKSVKFDSSVIILTSSDEETTVTPKKKSDKNESSVNLKSALKNSLSHKPSDILQNKKDLKIKVADSSLDCEIHIDSSPRESRRSKDSNKVLNPFRDKKSRHDRKSKHKTDDRDKENLKDKKKSTKTSAIKEDDSSGSEFAEKSLKKGESREKNNLPDSKDGIKNNDSGTEEEDENLSANSTKRRSSTRIGRNAEKAIQRKDSLKKLFKRRDKQTEHKTSNKKQDSSDDDSAKTKKKKSRSKRKDVLDHQHLSDTSSLSDDESEIGDSKLKTKNLKKRINKGKNGTAEIDVNDKQLTYQVYIPLPLIKCEEIKDVYLRNREILEMKSLTDMKSLRRSKRGLRDNNNSKSSSDTEKPKAKKSKKSSSKKDAEKGQQDPSDPETCDAPAMDVEFESTEKPNNGGDDPLLAIMDGINDSDEENRSAGNKSDGDSSEESKTRPKKKKKAIPKGTDDDGKTNKRDSCSNENNTKSDTDNVRSCDNSGSDKDKAEKSDNSNSDTEEKSKSKNKMEKEKGKRKGSKEDKETEEGISDDGDKNSDNESDSDKDKSGKSSDNDSDSGKKKKSKNKTDTKKGSEDELKTDDEENSANENNGKSKNGEKSGSESGSDDEKNKKKNKKWRNDKLLSTKIDSTDSEEEFSKFSKKKEKSRSEIMSDDDVLPVFHIRKTKKRMGKAFVISSGSEDSDTNKRNKKRNKKKSPTPEKNSSDSSEESDKSDESEREEKEEKKQPARRRIRKANNSSSSGEEDKSTRKKIRGVLDKDSLSETTKKAEAEEKERKARIAEKQKKYNKIFESKSDSIVEKLVLDYDEKSKKELLSVNKDIVKKLKPHQASGVQFMWDACFESLKRTNSTQGSGCILAHCMGLGKTLQVIALTHTLLKHSSKTGVNKVMVVCPINTVLNWKAEFKKWLPVKERLDVYELVSAKQLCERQYNVSEWHTDGGVLIIGYAMFRNLSNPDNKRMSKKMRNVFHEGLVDPGPDLVVCDEGHLLKNEKTHLSVAMNRIKTARRIVLTGTPLQNNLKEYWCMVQFIKPNLLGSYKEYLNRFVNPITNGQYTDSTQHDTLLMRKRSHVLHKLLDGVVQRQDYAVLEPYLPPKHEYVLFVSLSKVQVQLYQYYMDKFARQSNGTNKTSFLFTDFQQLQRICTHPRVLFDKSNEMKEKLLDDEEDSEGSLKDFIDDDNESSAESTGSSSNSGSDSGGSIKEKNEKKKKTVKGKQQKVRVTRAQAAQKKGGSEEDSDVEEVVRKEWFQEFCDGEELDNVNNSGKLFLLFQILKECEDLGDKVLVFSQSLYTLNCIEYFLEKIDEATQKGEQDKVGGHTGSWAIGLDYFRLDGSSSCDNRATWCDQFNNPDNIRARLFLISTKAGGLGINLVAANRVIIFDVSWNPSHDIQSIYRVYRFGQTKPCYIYRFVTYGTMEMKIYERQVTKQAISKRVIDEQQIDRHYNQNDLQELYNCDLAPKERPIPLVPKDVLLGELLQKYDKTIYKYHLHQSLLENKTDEGLNEEERKAAWDEFENEKVLRKNTTNMGMGGFGMNNPHSIAAALTNIVRKDNPTWSDVQIRGIIPALVQQLQVQLTEGDMSMYARVQQEIQIMQALQAQKMKEAYYQQQVMRMIQMQQQQAASLGNMNVELRPAQLVRSQASIFHNLLTGGQPQVGQVQGPSTARRPMPNEVIELND